MRCSELPVNARDHLLLDIFIDRRAGRERRPTRHRNRVPLKNYHCFRRTPSSRPEPTAL
jgi:hypothetical protein